MATCSTCGNEDESSAAKGIYHKCGHDALRVMNIKFREMLDAIGDIASNQKLPHDERLNQVLSMIGKKPPTTSA
jgi:hypothetical protein